jgi:TolB protein
MAHPSPHLFEGSLNQAPLWTPDGKRIVFNSNNAGAWNLFWQLSDGGGGLQRLSTGEAAQIATSWSRDGQLLAFYTGTLNTLSLIS